MFFNNFGDLIRNCIIDFEFIDVKQGGEIIHIINDKSFESLKGLLLHNCTGNVLDNLKNTFARVVGIEFSSHSNENLIYNAKNRRFFELFPKVNFLYLLHTKPSDWAFIDGHFQMITTIGLELPENTEQTVDVVPHFISFLKQNKQIHEIHVMHVSLRFLNDINEILPGLVTLKFESLALDYLNYNGDDTQFESVIELLIESSREDEVPQNIVFNNLKFLDLNIVTIFSDKWITFIEKQINPNLETFSLYTNNLTKEQFLAMPEKLQKLQSIVIDCWSNFEPEDILNFLEKCNEFETVRFIIRMDEQKLSDLQQSFRFRWDFQFRPLSNRIIITIKR